MIHQFYVISPRGDTIIFKDYRGGADRNHPDEFFRQVKFWPGGSAPPAFSIGNTQFIHIKRNDLLFVVTTKQNVSPSMVIELLGRVSGIIKDYCGLLTEEAIRLNFILVYEILDEVLDYGCPQTTATESLKYYIYNDPIVPSSILQTITQAAASLPTAKTQSSTATQAPISFKREDTGKQRKEVYVDIMERLSVVFAANGTVITSSIDGYIQLKSYLAGRPLLKLGLNEDLVIGRGTRSFGSVTLDDCNFHECVELDDEFENRRVLKFYPPDGEFILMNYRISNAEFRMPFRLFPSVNEVSPVKFEVILVIRADIPEAQHATNVAITIPVPKSTQTASVQLTEGIVGQLAEYNQRNGNVIWKIKKFEGGTEHTLIFRVTLGQPATIFTRKEFGPIGVNFEIPMYNLSRLQVRYLQITENSKSYNPYRWVRYITQAASYVCRV